MENSKLLSNIKLQRPKSATGLSKTPQGAGNVIPVKSPSVRTRPTTATGSIRSVLKSSNVSSAIPSTPTPLSPTNLSVMSGVSSSARETAKMAKLQNTAERVQKVSELKDKWVKEKEDKVSRNLERRADELKRLRDISNAASEQRRQNAERQKKIASAAKAARIENIAKSVEDRAFQQAELENQAKQRRRQSILLNTEIKAKAAENQRKIAAANKAQEDDILATRRLDYLEIKAIKKARAEQERADAASRSEAAHREKEALAKAMAKKADEERALIELRHHAWLDEQASKKQDIHQQKLDVSVSLDEWRAGRVVEDAVLQQQKLESSRILEQRRADWQALQQFKTSQIARDRQSLVERLGVWRCERTLEAQQKQALDEAEEIERELKAAELEDVKKYIEKQKQRDRESLCFRLGKAHLDKIHHDGEEQYRKAMSAKDRELSQQARQDVQAAKALRSKRDRQSLAASLVTAKRQHEQDLEAHTIALDLLHADLESKRADWLERSARAVHEQSARRISVAMRLDSWREQRLAEEKQAQQKRLEKEEESHLHEADRIAIQEARARELEQELTDRLRGSMVL